jgi:triacylglycerol lipase
MTWGAALSHLSRLQGIARSRSVNRSVWFGHPFNELAWQLELAKLVRSPVWRNPDVVHGRGQPVLLVPGFLSGDPSVLMLRRWLRRCGFHTRQAGILLNVDSADRALKRLETRAESLAQIYGQPIHVVAHSRGGLFARALAHRRPELLGKVITLGSPLGAELDCAVSVKVTVGFTRAAQGLIRPSSLRKGCFTASCSCDYAAHLTKPCGLDVELTSIYPVEDGIVRPAACMVPDAHCIAVRGSHLGLVVNAEVYEHLGRILGESVGREVSS